MEIKLMNIKSPLQRRTILEINKICGIQELALFVSKYKGSINPRDRLLITSQIEYYRLLYNSFVNVEADMLTYLKLAIQTREMLIQVNEELKRKRQQIAAITMRGHMAQTGAVKQRFFKQAAYLLETYNTSGGPVDQ